jgi:hypothetical protein
MGILLTPGHYRVQAYMPDIQESISIRTSRTRHMSLLVPTSVKFRVKKTDKLLTWTKKQRPLTEQECQLSAQLW